MKDNLVIPQQQQQQTWWNDNVTSDENVFYNWICDSNAMTKKYGRSHIILNNYKSMLDVGCANTTMYNGFQEDGYEIDYTGIDSCKYFVKRGVSKDVNVVYGDVNSMMFRDNLFDVVYSRHIIEHQRSCEELLQETIRVAKYEVLHVFFKKPNETFVHEINYDKNLNLYHNTYSRYLIEYLLSNHSKVMSYRWNNDVKADECVLHILVR